MSDSVKKYFEMVEDGLIDPQDTMPKRPNIDDYIISEGAKKEAYTILSMYREESILEAARILKRAR